MRVPTLRLARETSASDLMISTLSFRLRLLAGTLFLPIAAASQTEPAGTSAPSLEATVAAIVESNPELAFYEAEIEAARAGLRLAKSRENPELSFDIGRKRVTDAGGNLSGDGAAWSVAVTQVFDWPGRMALRKSIANRDVELAELGLARFKAALAARARTLAYGLNVAAENSAATSAVAARYRNLREVFLARDPAGITPLLETRVIEAQELVLQRRATEARLAYRAAQVELNQLRGQPADEPVEIAVADFHFTAVPKLDSLIAAAQENNFEFRFARLELDQQGAVVSLARHERRPSFTVGPYFSQEKAGERDQTIGISVSLAFVGYRTLSRSRRLRRGEAAASCRRASDRATRHGARGDRVP